MDTLIAVPHPIFCEGIKKIIGEESEITIQGTVQNKNDLDSLSLEGECILILDLAFLGLNRRDTIKTLVENHQGLEILVIGEGEAHDDVKDIMQAGAAGYISKNQSTDKLVKAVKKIGQGNIYLSDETICMFYNETDRPAENRKLSAELTEREIEVLVMICRELTNREIAGELSISVRTVDAHRRNILQKTGAANTAGLVKYAIKHQIYNL